MLRAYFNLFSVPFDWAKSFTKPIFEAIAVTAEKFAPGSAMEMAERRPVLLGREESPLGPDPDTGVSLVMEHWDHPDLGRQSVHVFVHPDQTETRDDPRWLRELKGEDQPVMEAGYRQSLAQRGAESVAALRRERAAAALQSGHLMRYAPDVVTSRRGDPEMVYAVVFANGRPTARSPEQPGADGVIEYFGAKDLAAVAADGSQPRRVIEDAARALGELDPVERPVVAVPFPAP